MTIKGGLLPVLTEVRKIRYGYKFDYDDLVEALVTKTNVKQTTLAIKVLKLITDKDRKSEDDLIKYIFNN